MWLNEDAYALLQPSKEPVPRHKKCKTNTDRGSGTSSADESDTTDAEPSDNDDTVVSDDSDFDGDGDSDSDNFDNSDALNCKFVSLDGKVFPVEASNLSNIVKRACYSNKTKCSGLQTLVWSMPCGIPLLVTGLFAAKLSEPRQVQLHAGWLVAIPKDVAILEDRGFRRLQRYYKKYVELVQLNEGLIWMLNVEHLPVINMHLDVISAKHFVGSSGNRPIIPAAASWVRTSVNGERRMLNCGLACLLMLGTISSTRHTGVRSQCKTSAASLASWSVTAELNATGNCRSAAPWIIWSRQPVWISPERYTSHISPAPP